MVQGQGSGSGFRVMVQGLGQGSGVRIGVWVWVFRSWMGSAPGGFPPILLVPISKNQAVRQVGGGVLIYRLLQLPAAAGGSIKGIVSAPSSGCLDQVRRGE